MLEQSTWTEERTTELRRLWDDGLSCSQIAGQLGGVTRNAIIGKVHRLGLSGRLQRMSPEERIAKDRGRDAARNIRRIARRAANKGWRKPEWWAPASDEAAVCIPPALAPCSLLELTPDTCRFPFGDPREPDFAFCGGIALDGKPYCRAHTPFAYRPRAAA